MAVYLNTTKFFIRILDLVVKSHRFTFCTPVYIGSQTIVIHNKMVYTTANILISSP